jgi:hypothetical protein
MCGYPGGLRLQWASALTTQNTNGGSMSNPTEIGGWPNYCSRATGSRSFIFGMNSCDGYRASRCVSGIPRANPNAFCEANSCIDTIERGCAFQDQPFSR